MTVSRKVKVAVAAVIAAIFGIGITIAMVTRMDSGPAGQHGAPHVADATTNSASGSSSRPITQGRVLREGDLVVVRVWDLVAPNVETARTTRVGKDGQVTPPSLGGVKVAGLLEKDAEIAIAKAYAEAQMIQRANVSVERVGDGLRKE
jgi:protein involved in polysaccharide export with SLBB domain